MVQLGNQASNRGYLFRNRCTGKVLNGYDFVKKNRESDGLRRFVKIGENMATEMEQKQEKVRQLAKQVLTLSFDQILVQLRFFDLAMSRLKRVERPGMPVIGLDGANIFYDPVNVLRSYQEEQTSVTRTCLHSLLHCIFHHAYDYAKKEPRLWNLATDMAVENIIIRMELNSFRIKNDEQRKSRLLFYQKEAGGLTAEKLYRYFQLHDMSDAMLTELEKDFTRDIHIWEAVEQLEVSEEDWKKISERIRQELKAFSGEKGGDSSLLDNIEESGRTKYNYPAFLQKFMTLGEDMTVNDDEFDYVYYTYGLSLYRNLPLVEPLEYKDTHKIKEFVIAIDTSASCRGNLIRSFLQKTYEIMKCGESFFSKVNIHILQCDTEVQSDTVITCDEDFDEFMRNGKMSGFGGTDFRAAFRYVDALMEKGEFENLKGMIYFTDGYGVFPEKKPSYETAFVFVSEYDNQPNLPYWAIKLVLAPDEVEKL